MRLKKPFTLLMFLCFILSCNKEVTLTFNDVTVTPDTSSMVQINIPKALGETTTSEHINTAIEDVIKSVLQVGDLDTVTATSVEESISNFNKEFNAFKTDFPDSPQQWEAQIDGEVMYQSPEIVSIALTSYINTGGAHGILAISFLNFDALTGEKLENTQLFNNLSEFEKIAKSYFDKEVDDKRDLYFEPDNFLLPANIGLNDEGVVLLYNSYEIAPYSTGLTEFSIPFEAVQSYLHFK